MCIFFRTLNQEKKQSRSQFHRVSQAFPRQFAPDHRVQKMSKKYPSGNIECEGENPKCNSPTQSKYHNEGNIPTFLWFSLWATSTIWYGFGMGLSFEVAYTSRGIPPNDFHPRFPNFCCKVRHLVEQSLLCSPLVLAFKQLQAQIISPQLMRYFHYEFPKRRWMGLTKKKGQKYSFWCHSGES